MQSSFIYKKGFFTSRINNKEIKIAISKPLFNNISKEALCQLHSISSLKEVVSPILAMPDIHPGFGVPIGSVFASSKENAVISPEAVGYDINCGIRLLKTDLFLKDLTKEEFSTLAKQLKKLPLGLSSQGLKITTKDLDDILRQGANWCVSKKYCEKKELSFIYNKGHFKDADPKALSKEAKKRGKTQVGTLGQGNHFLDVLEVSEIFNKEASSLLGLKKGQLVVMLHTGSRGLGHQVASDFHKNYNQKEPLSHASFSSKEGIAYYKAMCAAANFAFVNRIVLSFLIKDIFQKTLNRKINFSLLYDLSHNIASLEKHSGKGLLVTRKGATRVFLKEELPSKNPFKKTGSPIVLPGSMLDDSFILLPDKGVKETFNSVAHGSGRLLSRKEAKDKISFKELRALLEKNNVILENLSENLAREEQPFSYKASNDVVSAMQDAKMIKRVARLKPLIVLIG